MTKGVPILAILLSLLVLFACSSKQPPQPDPLKQEITILQQQLLELQKQQNETYDSVQSLSSRLRSIEERRSSTSASVGSARNKQADSAEKNKPVKKKKKKRNRARRSP